MTSRAGLISDRTPASELSLLLSEPARAAAVDLHQAVSLLDALAAHEGRCRLIRDLLTARLTTQPAESTPREQDQLIDDVREVARMIRRSVSWVRKHGHTLPGFKQPGGKGCKVAWSRRALLKWMNSGCTGSSAVDTPSSNLTTNFSQRLFEPLPPTDEGDSR